VALILEWAFLKVIQATSDIFGESFLIYHRARSDFVAVIDAQSAKLLKTIDINSPGRIAAGNGALYIFSERTRLLRLDPETGKTTPFLDDLKDCSVHTADGLGNVYVAKQGKDKQILKYSPEGKLLLKIGKQGGRVRRGHWNPAGMNSVWGMAVDARGRIWAAETDIVPKRFSVWNTTTGAFVKEYLGPPAPGR